MPIFAIPKQNGALAERLGTGLQNLLERFDSARHLTKMPYRFLWGIFLLLHPHPAIDPVHDYGYGSVAGYVTCCAETVHCYVECNHQGLGFLVESED